MDSAKESAFEDYYSRSGPWFKFFEPCADYLGHDLLKSEEGSSFIIIDKWMGRDEYEKFLESKKSEYELLNADSSSLYSFEKLIGSYHAS